MTLHYIFCLSLKWKIKIKEKENKLKLSPLFTTLILSLKVFLRYSLHLIIQESGKVS